MLGIWIASFLQLIVRDALDEFLSNHLEGLENSYIFLKLLAVIGMVGLFIGIQIGAYFLATMYGSQMNEADDSDPIISNSNDLCKMFDKANAFNNYTLNQVGLCVPFFGAIAGVLLQAKCFNGQKGMVTPEEEQTWKAIGRFAVLLLLTLPWIILFYKMDFENDKWLNIVRYALPFFCWTLTLTFLLDIICFKLKLYDSHDDIVAKEEKTFQTAVVDVIKERKRNSANQN